MVMILAKFTDRADLRNIETTLNLCGNLYHSGIRVMRRSTLAEANEIIEYRPANKCSGVLTDETIRLTGHYSARKNPKTLRLIVREDFKTGKANPFLANNFAIEGPQIIADLYHERWRIELFFKWIKQHKHIKTFFGISQNAVSPQTWIAVCDNLFSSLQRNVISWFQVIILSLTQSDKSSSRGDHP